MDYEYYASSDMETVIPMLIFLAVFYLLVIAFAVVCYVLECLGVYTIAKRRGIKKPWLSWLPVGSEWILGSIADQYQYVAKGQVKNRRKWLLVLSIVNIVLAVVLVVQYIGLFVKLFSNIYALEYMSDAQAMELLMGPMLGMLGVAMVMMVVSIVYAVFVYIALYNLFQSCDPSNAVLYLVLSILLGVVLPFFLFACRKKDLGMPPRRQPIPDSFQPAPRSPESWQSAQPPVQPTAEPWEHNGEH